MTDVPNTTPAGEPEAEEFEAESRWLSWKEADVKRTASRSREQAEDSEETEAMRLARDAGFDDPFRSTRSATQWGAEALRSLLDVQFRRPATRTLLPLAYILCVISFAIGLPIALTVLMWKASAVLGVLAALVAVPLGLTIAASVRLMLEFADNAARLAGRVEHISELADGLFQALSDVAEPVNQLSEDVRAVQFWRFRKKK
ncbi:MULTISPECIES: DUF4282 domain-containing protein [Nocardia]|uniref:Uncharacterized protein DUF4282 n=2 Tax=Nocardia TaxID=1817 RepID=A0A4V3CN27_NOCIG|nr:MULTISPECIES: DUF4282 domain-containing protein [Nocardia]MCA2209261.1 DUF4282 domain-containing protein [Nocardia rosealba]NKX89319.1 DUF4282 domain-containing protein [Nocardia coubleae]TDP32362.1 uncharacterized protein DUF4282 [Nocardia ignorata]